jgi:Protein of unknown function (DUF3467)
MSGAKNDVEDAEGKYANVFKVGFNAYEWIIDFGQQYPPAEARMHTRIVISVEFARNLRDVLDESMRQYEWEHRSEKEQR